MWSRTLKANEKKTKSAPRALQRNHLSFGKTVFLVVVAILVLGIFLIRDQRGQTLQFGSKTLQLEIANTDELRTKGLSGRESLPANQAMWFEFGESSVHCFWMKDMNFPIDIIWLNEQRKVVHVKENAQPSSYPESFCPDGASKYVLEVQSGLVRQENITIGSQL